MLLIVVFAVALALALERLTAQRSLDAVREDFGPTESLVDPDEVFALTYTLRNARRRPVLFLRLRQDLPEAFHPRDSALIRAPLGDERLELTTWLRPRQEARFTLPLSADRRGYYPLSALEVSGGDFLGLRERTRVSPLFRAVTVVPREAEDPGLEEVLGGFLGEVSVRRFIHEDPVLTAGFREYTGREPMRAISWTQSARGLGMMVKIYDHTAQPSVSVLLNADGQGEDLARDLEICYSLARTVCRTLEERGIQYDFVSNAMELNTFFAVAELGDGLGQRHFEGVLERLGRSSCQASYPGERLLERSAATRSHRGRILITPGPELDESPALARLRELTGDNVLVLRAREAA